MKKLALALIFALASPLGAVQEPADPPMRHIRTINPAVDGNNKVGKRGATGWELDYKRDRPGYALNSLTDPILTEEGLYRATFHLRRGHYPKKGLLFKSYGLFRIEIWDVTAKQRIIARELQIGDFSDPNRYEPRWMEFDMSSREGHCIEPRVYWLGLANGEVANIDIDLFPPPLLKPIEEKEQRISLRLLREHLENGFVVSRKPTGEADETGDATTYTGFYAASLAWKYAATGDAMTYQALENALETLHNAIKGPREEPLITRFVDDDGTPFPKNPSKDVYLSFFLAMSAAYPQITNESLKKQMRIDTERVASKFLRDGLLVRNGDTVLFSLTPYLTDQEIRYGIRSLLGNKKNLRKFIKNLRLSHTYLPFGELWPGMKKVIAALEEQNENKVFDMVLPTLNGAFQLVERVRDILREQYRTDLFPRRFTNKEYPGIKLADTLTDMLKRFPTHDDGLRARKVSDVKVLASNALIALHIVKTAAAITKKSQFSEYYNSNLYSQDELLKTALDWYGTEDDLTRLTAGNATADSERRGYLGMLALVNLINLEDNPAVKETYMSILRREWEHYQNEDNPMTSAFVYAETEGKWGSRQEILRALALYPEDGAGLGIEYWKENGKEVAEKWGGGEKNGSSREPLPISMRPRDSFLWQRNARRLSGDEAKQYPGTDFLFVYWYCRANKLIPASKPEPVAHK